MPITGAGGPNLPEATQANAVVQRSTSGAFTVAPLTMDQILPAFSVSMGGGLALEVGQTVVHPSFTASYSDPPALVTLTDDQGSPAKDVSATPYAFASDGTFVKTARNTSALFTVHAQNAAGVVKLASVALAWYSRARWAAAAPPSGDLAAFILSLTSSALRSARTGAVTANAGAGQAFFHAFPAAFGTPVYTLAGGFTGGWSIVDGAVNVTNAFGVTETFALYRSNTLGLGSATFNVT